MTNKIRNVTKQLLGAEDVLFGRGTVNQRRGTADVSVHRLDLALPVADEAELAVTDPEQYPKASIGSRNFVAVNGQYQEVSTIQPVLFSVGAMMSAEYPYAIDGDTVAKWTGAFPKTLTLADQGFTNPGWLVISTGLGRAIISETVPSASFTREGVRWYKPSESTTYVYYCDGDSCQWVQEPVQSAEGTLRQELGAAGSDVLVGGVQAGYLADAYNQRRVDIRFFGVLFDGSDEGPKLRTALAAGVPLYFPPNKTIVVNFDPASAFDDGGVTRYSRCIAIPSNADLMFGSNFKIKGADGLQNWTRVVVMENVQNIKIHGALFVDGNVQNVGTPNNEHMHCVFMFNVKNTEIDTIHGINARGDNVFIGGTDEVTFSDNVRIGSVIGTTAGRKNLVLHMADNLHIEYALLDNSAGGAAVYGGTPDDTDKHCLDLEPDAFTASKVFRQYIGNLRTFGLGNDFTVGITPDVADAWQLTIGSAYCKQSGAMSGSVKAWLQYGVTINVLGDLQILDCDGVNRPVFLQYAARLNVGGKLKINGSCPNAGESMLFATAAGGNTNTPRVRATELYISCTNGGGAILRSCHLKLDEIRLDCPAFGLIVGDNVDMATHKAITNIGRLISTDTGTTYVMLVDTPVLAAPYVTVGEVMCYDTRGTKANAVFQIDSNNSANFTVGAVTELSGVPLVTWVGSDKYLKTSVQQYVCQGTPEGMIPAPIGSIASRLDGGASTSFYVKQSGTGNTGWVAK